MSSWTSAPSQGGSASAPLDPLLARNVLEQLLAVEELTIISAHADLVESRPGSGTCIGWDVKFDGPQGPSQGYFVVSDVPEVAQMQHVVSWDHDGVALSAWRFPADPMLPALAQVSDLITAPSATVAWTGEVTRIDVVTYRPLRRSVLRLQGEQAAIFAKVLLPSQVTDAVARHAMVAGSGVPAPDVLDWRSDGLVLLSALTMPALAEVLHGNEAGSAALEGLDPRAITRMLDALPPAALELPEQTPWAARMTEFGQEHAAAADESASDLDGYWRDLAAEVWQRNRSVDLGPIEATHGDLNAANLRVSTGSQQQWGVIDLDTIGPGHRVDDLACLIAHMAALPAFAAQSYASVPSVLSRFLAHFDTVVDPTTLRVRVAGVLVTLAVAEQDPSRLHQWATVARGFLDDA